MIATFLSSAEVEKYSNPTDIDLKKMLNEARDYSGIKFLIAEHLQIHKGIFTGHKTTVSYQIMVLSDDGIEAEVLTFPSASFDGTAVGFATKDQVYCYLMGVCAGSKNKKGSNGISDTGNSLVDVIKKECPLRAGKTIPGMRQGKQYYIVPGELVK